MAHESRAAAARAWAVVAAVLLARAYRALLLTLVVIATLPTLFGWDAYVTRSGSMEPSIAVGDVVLARTVDAQDEIEAGRVYVFSDPAAQHDKLLVHRIVERDSDGDYVTAGDANEALDVTPVSREEITGRGILLVPYVGLPVAWLQSGAWPRALLWLAVTIAAFVLASRRLDEESPTLPGRWLRGRGGRSDAGAADEMGDSTETARTDPAVVRRVASAVVGASVALLLTTVPTANAMFTDQSTNGSNTWQAGRWVHEYVSEVLADAPFGLWLLDEDGGGWAADRSGADRTGRYHGIAAYGEPGGLPNNPGTSIRPGTGRVVLGPNPVRVPSSHTTELWFRTTSTQGGFLAGFESTTEATSRLADRTLLMDTSGRLVYGLWDTNPQRTITSPVPYNDGQWHHVALAAVRQGSQQQATLYVDGVEVASGRTSKVESYDGWWRTGSGTVRAGSGIATSFPGLIDNVAIYDKALSGDRIRAHWEAR